MEPEATDRTGVTDDAEVLDALVIGAGFAGVRGLYQLHARGMNVRMVERGGGVGGTWYWNRYPGARTDSDAYSYSFYFTRELAEEWSWPEHFGSQRDIERYLNWIVDRFGMRDSVQLRTTVSSAHWDDDASLWRVGYLGGGGVSARYLVMATGMMSYPVTPRFKGIETFKGLAVHTGEWPEEDIDFAGKRVAVFGTGSSGVQVVPNLAKVAASVTVFQRKGHWSTPLNNRAVTADEKQWYRENPDEVLRQIRADQLAQALHARDGRSALDVTEHERQTKFDYLYNEARGLRITSENFADIQKNPEANEFFNEFLKAKIRERVKNPEVAEMLIPDHPFGVHRPPKDVDGFYEAFNEENVRLVSTKRTPIEEITATGIRTSEENFDVDIIVFATGFDAWLSTLRQIEIRGAEGADLNALWSEGPYSHLGIMVPGFPNMFFVGGPQGVGANSPAFIEVHAEFIGRLLDEGQRQGAERITTSVDAADAWTGHIEQTAAVFDSSTWYFGANVEGSTSAGRLRVYPLGMPKYLEAIEGVEANGFEGFVLTRVEESIPAN